MASPVATSQHLDEELFKAAKSGSVEEAERLLKDGANPNYINTSFSNYTPLHRACWSQHPEVVKLLLEHKAKINMLTSSDDSALHLSCCVGGLESVKILLAHEECDTSVRDWNRKTAYELAKQYKHTAIVEYMEKFFESPEYISRSEYSYWYVLGVELGIKESTLEAIKRDHKEIDKQHEALMMELGKDPNVKMEDFLKAFKSPRVGRPDMAEKLGAKIKEDEKQKN